MGTYTIHKSFLTPFLSAHYGQISVFFGRNFGLAAEQGDAVGKKSRDIVAAKLDPTSLAEAQKLSAEYFKRYVEPFH